MKHRRLTPQEDALWQRVARNAKPLKSRRRRQGEMIDSAPPALEPRQTPAANRQMLQAGPPRLACRRASLSPFVAGDPKIDRRARLGKVPIDATLDLHGYTQAAARAALYGFILRARAQGFGCVLIITGKGVSGGAPLRQTFERGVLRARFKEWLCEDNFRQYVVRASPAHAKHGGDGAFYVFLKKSRRK